MLQLYKNVKTDFLGKIFLELFQFKSQSLFWDTLQFFVLIITLMLSKTFSEELMSTSNKHSYKTSTKSPPVSLPHWIENILNH